MDRALLFGLPRKCLGFTVGAPIVLVLVWIHYYDGYSMGGCDMNR